MIWWSAFVLAIGVTAYQARAQELGDLPDMTVVAGDEPQPAPEAEVMPTVASADEESPAVWKVAQLGPPADAQKPGEKRAPGDEDPDEFEEYDPWQPFNEETFEINRKLDKYVLKPVARAYDKVVPTQVQRSIANVFDNVGSVRRVVNSVAQGRFETAGQELGRFVFNTIFGIGGLFDVAKSELGIESKSIDAGQTFGVFGAPPGPYLVIPAFPPFTVREAVGYVVDSFLNPLRYIGMDFPTSVAVEVEDRVNYRALNLETFDELEASVFDLYSAVRNGYLQRRQRMIEDGRGESVFFGGRKKDR
jgi:phospholipid-binding lipoprotein MlaA